MQIEYLSLSLSLTHTHTRTNTHTQSTHFRHSIDKIFYTLLASVLIHQGIWYKKTMIIIIIIIIIWLMSEDEVMTKQLIIWLVIP